MQLSSVNCHDFGREPAQVFQASADSGGNMLIRHSNQSYSEKKNQVREIEKKRNQKKENAEA